MEYLRHGPAGGTFYSEHPKPIPREYQVDAILAILGAWADDVQRPACVLPTGAGKTIIFATLCAMLARRGNRPLVLVARDELVLQTVAKLKAADPFLAIGVIQGPENELRGEITVASVQTLSRIKRLHQVDRNRFDRVIADEAHWAAADSWRRVLDYVGAFDKDSGTKVVGFTATMTRTDKRGLGEIWDEVVFELPLRWMIDHGHLVRPRAITVTIDGLDLTAVKIRNGDLADGDLGKAMAQAKAGPLIAAAYSEHGRTEAGELRRGIVFAPTITTAEAFLADFRAAGIPTELVIGTTPRAERQAAYAATTAGTNRVLMSVGVLTTGFDLPACEVVCVARPTASRGLYQQMVGRVLRTSPGKVDALILDVVGAARMGLASIVDLKLDEPETDGDGPDLDPLLRGPRILDEALEAPEQIGFEEIDPFGGLRRKLLRRAASKRWLTTRGGVPFLPGGQHTSTVFLWPEPAGGWTVGEIPAQGRVTRHETFADFPLAVQAAVGRYTVPSKLTGAATAGQVSYLARCGHTDLDGLTKAEAGERISIEIVSRKLDL